MKLIKYLLFLILLLVVGGAIFFGTKNAKFEVSETKVINAPAEVIYDQVKDFNNWKSWAPWFQIDPNIQITQSEKSEGEGATYTWKSKHDALGNVSIETKKVIPLKEIYQEIVIETILGDYKSDIYWKFEDTEKHGQTRVIWGVKGDPSFLDKIKIALRKHDISIGVGILFPEGLSNLDSKVMTEINKFVINVDGITNYQGGFFLYTTSASKISEIGSKLDQMMLQVSNFMNENKIQTTGMPFTMYNEIDTMNSTAIYSTCIPVANQIITPTESKVLCGFMPQLTALKTTLKGKYDYIEMAYEASNEYLSINNIQIDPTRKKFEVYPNNHSLVANPAEWLTEIYIPIISTSNPQE